MENSNVLSASQKFVGNAKIQHTKAYVLLTKSKIKTMWMKI